MPDAGLAKSRRMRPDSRWVGAINDFNSCTTQIPIDLAQRLRLDILGLGCLMRVLQVFTLCAMLGGCAASVPEVRAGLGQEYIGKNVDALVVRWGPPTSMFRMNSGQGSYFWQLSSVTDIAMNHGRGSAATYGCKVSVIASPTGVVTQLDTEDYNPGGSGLIGLAGALGAYGSMCGQRLGMKPQTLSGGSLSVGSKPPCGDVGDERAADELSI
jgi:hypothetical protein